MLQQDHVILIPADLVPLRARDGFTHPIHAEFKESLGLVEIDVGQGHSVHLVRVGYVEHEAEEFCFVEKGICEGIGAVAYFAGLQEAVLDHSIWRTEGNVI